MSIDTAVPAGGREARWKQEARFFDERADRIDDQSLYIDPLAWRRYTRPRLRRRFSPEFRLRVLGDLRGKKLLDIGCGDGLNGVMFAKMGADVTGLDVSAGAIRVAHRRAVVNGVADRMKLVCAPAETAGLADDSFDIVWAEGFLHHVLDELELVVRQLARWTKPGGILLFTEPLNLNPTLRRLRQLIPVVTEATPGERPLVRAELDLVRRYVPDLSIRHFGLLGRLDLFVLTNGNYERSSWPRRAFVNVADAIDYVTLSMPLARNLGGSGVLWGHPDK